MLLKQLMTSIATMEGFFSSSPTLAQKNNNPGNLRASSLAIGKDSNELAIFQSVEDGWNALARQIVHFDAPTGKTLQQFIHGYAPASDGNNPEAYTTFVANQLGVDPQTPLSDIVVARDAGSLPLPGPGKTPPRPPGPTGLRRLSVWALLCLLAWCCSTTKAQTPGVSLDTLTVVAPPPQPVSQVSTAVTGPRGGVRYYYWVVANFPGGSAVPTPAIESNAPVFLTGSNFVTVIWSPLAAATSYDVLRTTSATFGASCTCAVATAQAGPSVNDTGSALANYTFAPKPGAVGTMRIDNRGPTPAWIASPALPGGGGTGANTACPAATVAGGITLNWSTDNSGTACNYKIYTANAGAVALTQTSAAGTPAHLRILVVNTSGTTFTFVGGNVGIKIALTTVSTIAGSVTTIDESYDGTNFDGVGSTDPTVPQAFLITGVGVTPGAIAGNLSKDLASNNTDGKQWQCMAALGAACSAVGPGNWVLIGPSAAGAAAAVDYPTSSSVGGTTTVNGPWFAGASVTLGANAGHAFEQGLVLNSGGVRTIDLWRFASGNTAVTASIRGLEDQTNTGSGQWVIDLLESCFPAFPTDPGTPAYTLVSSVTVNQTVNFVIMQASWTWNTTCTDPTRIHSLRVQRNVGGHAGVDTAGGGVIIIDALVK